MKIERKPADVQVSFSPDNYWLRKTEGYSTFSKDDAIYYGEYCVTVRIDMSYAGKDDQEGSVVMFLTETQASQFREAGFSELA